MLVSRGASVELAASDGRSVVFIAARNGHAALLAELVTKHKASAVTAKVDGWTAVHAAAGNGHHECLDLLLKMAPRDAKVVNAPYGDEIGWTPIIKAAGAGHLECVKLLVAEGANVNAQRNDGLTALHWASGLGHVDIVRLLLDAGADPALRVRKTAALPLHEAASRGHLEAVLLLASAAPSPGLIDAMNTQGSSPLHLAASGGFTHVCKALCGMAAQIDGLDLQGRTPAVCAASRGHLATAESLIELGADPLSPTRSGETLRDIMGAAAPRQSAVGKAVPQMSVSDGSVVHPEVGTNDEEAVQRSGSPVVLWGELEVMHTEPHISLMNNNDMIGSLWLTNYKLAFVGRKNSRERRVVLYLPLGMIAKVEKIGKKNGGAYGLEVHCKDHRTVMFAFPRAHNREAKKKRQNSRREYYNMIVALAFPDVRTKLFAYHHRCLPPATPAESKDEGEDDDAQVTTVGGGWDVYDFMTECHRLGLPSTKWDVCNLNSQFQMCATYPDSFLVPRGLSELDIYGTAQFRSKGRMPMCMWVHPENNAALVRCAQPLVGVKRSRSEADERFLSAIATTAGPVAGGGPPPLHIYDCRPRANAMGNYMMGGGTENTSCYPGATLEFLGIENIHVIRDSYRKVRELCLAVGGAADDDKWLPNLHNTHWLTHVKSVLVGSIKIARSLERGVPCLVHCSDGWDRTAQTCALAQLMLDPFYRTVSGFQVLVEKEWLAAGHKFERRFGHGDAKFDDDQRSPVFVQFVDCVWQMLQQNPVIFEFNEHFLETIIDAVYSCRFGTFLFNSQRERQEAGLRFRTSSLWSMVDYQIADFTNKLYVASPRPFFPRPLVRSLDVWVSYYGRWNSGLESRLHPGATVYEDLMLAEAEKAREAETADGNTDGAADAQAAGGDDIAGDITAGDGDDGDLAAEAAAVGATSVGSTGKPGDDPENRPPEGRPLPLTLPRTRSYATGAMGGGRKVWAGTIA